MLYELIMKTIDSCTTFVHVIGGFDGFGRDNGHFVLPVESCRKAVEKLYKSCIKAVEKL